MNTNSSLEVLVRILIVMKDDEWRQVICTAISKRLQCVESKPSFVVAETLEEANAILEQEQEVPQIAIVECPVPLTKGSYTPKGVTKEFLSQLQGRGVVHRIAATRPDGEGLIVLLNTRGAHTDSYNNSRDNPKGLAEAVARIYHGD